jgi:chemotaxis response regulator CheB/chemotaxis methyl-accepting protein methylase
MIFSAEQVEFIFQLAERMTGTSQQGSYRKEILLSNLKKRMNTVGVDDLFLYLNFAATNSEEKEWLVSALTIHTTSWFREDPHFEIIEKYIIEKLPHKKKFKLWSAACSTGEEVYTLGLVCAKIKEAHPDFDFEIFGTDIDPKSVRIAEIGYYNAEALNVIPKNYHNLLLVSDDRPAVIKVDDFIRERCNFAVADLTDMSPKLAETYDVVICRNVLIYFKPEIVDTIVEKGLGQRLSVGGLLVLGHSEILGSNFKDNLKLLSRSCYIKQPHLAKLSTESELRAIKPKDLKQVKPKILVVDDSITIRNSLRNLLTKKNCIVSTVASAAEASEELQHTPYDLVTLDLNMPGENGLSWLKRQRASGFKLPVVIISESSPQEAAAIFGALENGAQDYIVKKDITQNPEKLFELLDSIAQKVKNTSKTDVFLKPFDLNNFKPEVVLIGASTGGPQSLVDLLTSWPKPSPPVVIVQHITPEFSQPFAQRLSSVIGMPLAVLENSATELKPNMLYMSVGDYHLEIINSNKVLKICQNKDDKMSGHKPSVSKLFLSAATTKAACISILLTGMGHDGADGVNALGLAENCYNIAQDEKSSVVFGMPKKAIETNQVSFVGNIEQIKDQIGKILKKQFKAAS